MPDIRVTFMGLPFKTPFLLASGQATTAPGEIAKHCQEIAQNGWAGLVTKTIIPQYGAYKRPHLWSSESFRSLGMTNSGPPLSVYSGDLMKRLGEDIEAAHLAKLIIIPSIIANSLEEWASMADEIAHLGADALELNLSCPSPGDYVKESLGGYLVGQDIEMTRRVVETVCRACRIPVMPKLTFHAPHIGKSAKCCKEAGAAAVSAINTIRGIIGVDLRTGKILSEGFNGRTYLGGISGPMIRPFGLRAVAEIKMEEDLEVCGIGGVEGWKNAIEYFLLGATMVQVCTAAMWNGFRIGKVLKAGLIKYMEKKDYTSLKDFIGMALRDIDQKQIQEMARAWPDVEEQKCNLCCRCVRACSDAAYGALYRDGGRIGVDQKKCEGCGLCRIVCREDAIHYRLLPILSKEGRR